MAVYTQAKCISWKAFNKVKKLTHFKTIYYTRTQSTWRYSGFIFH